MRCIKPVVAVAAMVTAIIGERWLHSKVHGVG